MQKVLIRVAIVVVFATFGYLRWQAYVNAPQKTENTLSAGPNDYSMLEGAVLLSCDDVATTDLVFREAWDNASILGYCNARFAQLEATYATNPGAANLGQALAEFAMSPNKPDQKCSSCHIREQNYAGFVSGMHIPSMRRYSFKETDTAFLESHIASTLAVEKPHLVLVVAQNDELRAAYNNAYGTQPHLQDLVLLDRSDPAAIQSYFSNLQAHEKQRWEEAHQNILFAFDQYARQHQIQKSAVDTFVLSLVSPLVVLETLGYSEDLIQGAKLFAQDAGCMQCHGGPLYGSNDGTTIPSLRLVPGSRPYMQDGRAKDLLAVLDQYNRPGTDQTGLHLPPGETPSAPLSTQEKTRLFLFLELFSSED